MMKSDMGMVESISCGVEIGLNVIKLSVIMKINLSQYTTFVAMHYLL